MKATHFGTLPTGEEVLLYTLQSAEATVKIMNRGATVVSFRPYGVDIVGGFDTLEDYLLDTSHQGAVIGRVSNRIADAQFTMDGHTYHLPKNNKGNCLHGGDGFDHRMWTVTEHDDSHIVLTYTSADGEEGFPSALTVRVTYTLIGAALIIHYEATPEGKTPIALTNHSYFNLNGFGGTIEGHVAEIFANHYTEVDDRLIPNGNRPEVAGTPFDFRTPHAIGERVGGDFIGYDHNFILDADSGESTDLAGQTLPLVARVRGDRLQLSVYTDQPGVQFYIGNFLGGKPDFRGGVPQVLHGAFCLETQTEPNAIQHGVGYYDAGEVYTHTVIYQVEEL